MPEENNNAAGAGAEGAGAGEGQGSGDDNKPTPGANDAGQGDGGAGADDKGGAGAGAGQDDKGQGQDKNAKAPQQKADTDADDGKEPPTRDRPSPKDFIIQRLQKKVAKSKDNQGDEGGAGDEGDDDEIDPADEKMITTVVAKRFAPIFEKTLSAADDREIDAFLADNPDFKPFEAKARRFISHPSRRHLPIKAVFYEVAGDKLLQMGAARSKAADEKAKQTQTGGGSGRGAGEAKNDWELSKDEFAAKQERIRRGQKA